MMINKCDKVCIAAVGKHGKTWLSVYTMLGGRKTQNIVIYDPLKEGIYTRLARDHEHISLIRPKFPTSKHFNQVCMDALKQGNTRVIAEECHFYLKNRLNLAKYPGIMGMIYSERHRGCGLTALSRRFGAISTDLVSLCDHIFLGRMFSNADRHHAMAYLEDSDQWYRLKKLTRRHFAHFSDRGIVWRTCPRIKLR